MPQPQAQSGLRSLHGRATFLTVNTVFSLYFKTVFQLRCFKTFRGLDVELAELHSQRCGAQYVLFVREECQKPSASWC